MATQPERQCADCSGRISRQGKTERCVTCANRHRMSMACSGIDDESWRAKKRDETDLKWWMRIAQADGDARN